MKKKKTRDVCGVFLIHAKKTIKKRAVMKMYIIKTVTVSLDGNWVV